MNKARLLIAVVDDEESVRIAIRRLLRSANMNAETFSSGAEFLESMKGNQPDCVVLDLHMPGAGGLELQTALAEADDPMPVIFLTGHGDIPTSVRAMRQGAVDFLTKPVKKEPLFEAVGRALARNVAERERRACLRALQERYDTLTPREREVLAHVIAGQLNKQIAGDLHTCERTIKAHRAAIMNKLSLQSVAELVRFAQELGVPPAATSDLPLEGSPP